jgi:hypothetical protein
MTEAEWEACADAEILLEFLRGGLSDRKLRLFAAGSVRHFWDLLIDPRSREAVTVAESVADRLNLGIGLRAAYENAWGAVPEIPSARNVHVSAARAAGRTVEENSLDASQLTWNEIVGLHADLREEDAPYDERYSLHFQGRAEGERFLAGMVREIFGYPFRPVTFNPTWRTSDVMLLANGIYAERAFDRMPILADALQDAGCDSDAVLDHLRDPDATHVRGCWALDLVLGKE